MDPEKTPALPDAHQQIRLGDMQAAAQKWSAAIEYYSRAIEYFKSIRSTLQDESLTVIVHAQLVQCEKTLELCRLKERAEQARKAACQSKVTRAHSICSTNPAARPHRMMSRHNTIQIENSVPFGGREQMDSFAAMIFPNNNLNIQRFTKSPPPARAKKNKKNDSQKMEELETGYEATKNHLKVAFDEIERLKHENRELRMKNDVYDRQQRMGSESAPARAEVASTSSDKEESNSELEATL